MSKASLALGDFGRPFNLLVIVSHLKVFYCVNFGGSLFKPFLAGQTAKTAISTIIGDLEHGRVFVKNHAANSVPEHFLI